MLNQETYETGGGGTYGTPTDITGGTDPTHPPYWRPSGHGWWEFLGGVWRWVTDTEPRTAKVI